MHVVILIAALAGILSLLKRILPARMASRIPTPRTGAPSLDHRRIAIAVLTVVATLVLITAVDLGAFAADITDVFRRLHGLD